MVPEGECGSGYGYCSGGLRILFAKQVFSAIAEYHIKGEVQNRTETGL